LEKKLGRIADFRKKTPSGYFTAAKSNRTPELKEDPEKGANRLVPRGKRQKHEEEENIASPRVQGIEGNI